MPHLLTLAGLERLDLPDPWNWQKLFSRTKPDKGQTLMFRAPRRYVPDARIVRTKSGLSLAVTPAAGPYLCLNLPAYLIPGWKCIFSLTWVRSTHRSRPSAWLSGCAFARMGPRPVMSASKLAWRASHSDGIIPPPELCGVPWVGWTRRNVMDDVVRAPLPTVIFATPWTQGTSWTPPGTSWIPPC